MRSFPKLREILSIDIIPYKSMEGAVLKLLLDNKDSAYIHQASFETWEKWAARVGTCVWVQSEWRETPERLYRYHRILEDINAQTC